MTEFNAGSSSAGSGVLYSDVVLMTEFNAGSSSAGSGQELCGSGGSSGQQQLQCADPGRLVLGSDSAEEQQSLRPVQHTAP